MDPQYTLINDCLQVLRRCELPSIPKLRLEVQLFRIKLLLLNDDVSREVKERYCSQVVLQELHNLMVGLRGHGVSCSDIEAVSQRLQRVANDLAGTEDLFAAAAETEWK